jgi:guanosine-3',5'-bis(diphosphate) 3'-pyrophosphohydrolase
MDIQTLYQDAIKFAASRHSEIDQKVPGTNLPYIVHLCNVAMEIMITANFSKDFNLGLAIQVALLHDTVEDTKTTKDELLIIFGNSVAEGVLALTKDENLPKDAQMLDCLSKIKKQNKEIWAVKLADRITNLQPPPSDWSDQKKLKYQDESRVILDELKYGNEYLAKRLLMKIEEYGSYCNAGA